MQPGERPRTADIDGVLEKGLRSARAKEQKRAEELELRVAQMEHEKEALREADRHRADMVEKYTALQDEAERHKRDAQRSSELVKATRENLMFLTKALKMAKGEKEK